MFILGILIPAWALFMTLLERLFPYTRQIKLFRRGFWMDLIWYTFVQSKIMEILIFTLIIQNLKIVCGLEGFGPLSHWNFWGLILFFFVIHDFYIYWFHRLQHNNKYLWRTHEAHHSVREVDWLAGSRSHPLEILINQTIEFAPIFFLLDTETAAYVYPAKAALDALWGMWIHANVNVNTGPLQYIINGPEMHQWHHANHFEVFYKNYSTKLAVWDWIFGTAYLPTLKPIKSYFKKPIMFGLPYAYPKGYSLQLVYAAMRFDFKSMEENSYYKSIADLRKNITSSIFNLFSVTKKWTESELFDSENTRYQLDSEIHPCKNCGQPMKYYYLQNSLIFHCETCESNESLSKFN